MRPTATLMRLALCLSSAAPLVSAWPGWLPELDALVVRADKEGNTAEPTLPGNTAKPTPTDAPESSQTGDSSDDKTTKKGASKTTDKDDKKTTSAKKGSKTTDHKQFDPESPPGSVVMQTPGIFDRSAALYKIGDYITWGWNYTNLLGTPTAVDVLISCSTASETWTLTSNMTFKKSVAYTWDSSVQETSVESPLPVAMYTLIIKDSDAAISDVPDAGYLGTFSSFTFGLYTPQPYVPFPEWRCDACNAALSKFDHQVLGFAITMGLVTVLSFTWFVSGLDLN
ncbi:hypothetical protein MKX07_003713 [Trichoderma sp. CBMAI-0711]|uniref:SSCRP protein n=2 Tax=Trichoderma TaxID=5543 RepID=A0A2H3A7B2_TRIPA|nr:hypothetical protein MKX07_003713 [Trichoderma sp. CBMAI-0711]OTA08485.1 SSCRP protein [Trichoderma parareesei]